jgi:hypothetical protein
MKRKFILPFAAGAAVVLLSASTIISSNGIANYTGSPVDGGTSANGTCAGCHSGGATVPTLAVTSSPAFGGTGTSLTYVPSTTYTITVTPSGSYSRYGMNLELINSTSATVATYPFGTFGSALNTATHIYPTSQTGGYPACVSHTSSSGTGAFKFTWTAPASGTGYLYANVLGTNNNGSTNGDKTSATTAYTLTPASTTGITEYNHAANLSVFPNPATDNVRVNYSLEERGLVSVKLYSLSGEMAAELLNEEQDRGPHALDARLPMNLEKGVYVVKLSINGKHASQKLMVN